MKKGSLYLVSTPIGNLDDITLRGLKTLKNVDIIACEDTRRASILLNHYNIKKKLISFHSYNQSSRTSQLIKALAAGKDVALISDSGTPGISDPGSYLVSECIKNGINVSPIPGPSAAISALICSGLPTNGFIFLGFLPRKEGKIRKVLQKFFPLDKTILFYESPNRLLKTLKIIMETLGRDVRCVIAREITKKFEEFLRGKIADVIEQIEKRKVLGEIVVLIK